MESRRPTSPPAEARLALLVLRELGREHLEGDVAAEAGVAGAVDDAHAALPELLLDLEVPDGLADHRFALDPIRRTRHPWLG